MEFKAILQNTLKFVVGYLDRSKNRSIKCQRKSIEAKKSHIFGRHYPWNGGVVSYWFFVGHIFVY